MPCTMDRAAGAAGVVKVTPSVEIQSFTPGHNGNSRPGNSSGATSPCGCTGLELFSCSSQLKFVAQINHLADVVLHVRSALNDHVEAVRGIRTHSRIWHGPIFG